MKPTVWTNAYNIVLCHIVIVLVIRHSLVKSMRTWLLEPSCAQCNRQDGPTREGAHMAPKPYLSTYYNWIWTGVKQKRKEISSKMSFFTVTIFVDFCWFSCKNVIFGHVFVCDIETWSKKWKWNLWTIPHIVFFMYKFMPKCLRIGVIFIAYDYRKIHGGL